MVIRISDKTQNYSKVTKLLVKPSFNKRQRKATFEITLCNEIKEITLSLNVIDTTKPTETNG